MMSKKVGLVVVAMLLNASFAVAQTTASTTSVVGVWKADMTRSTFGFGVAPKSVTWNIEKDAPGSTVWRADIVDDKGNLVSYSWSGPADGTLQPLKFADGQVIASESLKREGAVLLRHGEYPDGSSFDSKGTMSSDGNTMTDVVTMKSKDGKTSQTTSVFHRVNGTSRVK